MFEILWIRSLSLFQFSWIKLGCYVKNEWYKIIYGIKWYKKLSDIGKYLCIEKGLRGGISYIAKRYTKANNKHMNNYDSKRPSQFIPYLEGVSSV